MPARLSRARGKKCRERRQMPVSGRGRAGGEPMAAPAGWEPVQRVPTYELVLRRIEEQLINRTLRPGDRLPPERELATMLGASRPLRVHLAVASFPLSDVVEARIMFERFSAVGAARAITPEFLAQIEGPLLAMDEPDIDRVRFNELDTEFHVAIAQAGGNQFVA